MARNKHIVPIPLDIAHRLFGIGATSLVSAVNGDDLDIMPAAWVCPLNIDPFRMTAVIDASHYTRKLIEASGCFALQLPSTAIADKVMALGLTSKNTVKDKVKKSRVKLFTLPGTDIPLVAGCVAWATFRVIPIPENQAAFDLFIGEATGAWADDRVFQNGHWEFEDADKSMRTLHHVTGSHFFRIGRSLTVPD